MDDVEFGHKSRMLYRTKLMVNFFKEQLKFTDDEILYFTEDEIRTLTDLLDLSKIFKRYNYTITPRLERLANNLFMQKQSNSSEMLNIFVSESRDESIKDFIVNRNPEFAYNIVHCKSD